MLLRRHWKWALLAPFLLLAGCSTGTTLDINREGFWGGYFVGPLSDALDWLAAAMFGQYGLAIMVITIIVRLIILPLTLKQYKSSKQMQAIQPQLQEIRQKYSTDPKKQQEETMKLFQQNGVNPLSGCFPLLIQMPVLIALYQSILGNTHIRDNTFLWLQLGSPDPIYVLPILAALTTFLQQKMMQAQMPQNMQMLMFIFPILILVMSWSFPSALVLYWVYSNIFTIVQSYFIYKPSFRGEAVKNVETSGQRKNQGGQQRKNGKRRGK
ncbi:YidC/Oxa1 family membrane protein insertase [Paenibacillus sp.]|uniref:YidC/Oxa1 family membrane protein insertase n=1 Tax=Paenibacillus sp. TaxID=58172 RepID=UPI002810BE02|nr:YidC/Oxa1 family membrane protein insertase [Paenibacillus sp.]